MKFFYQMVLACLCICLVSIGLGCSSNKQTTSMSPARFQEKVRVFEANMRAQLQDVELKLEMLQGNGIKIPDQSMEQWLDSSEQFEETHSAFVSKLGTISSQTQENWVTYRAEVDEYWLAVEAAFQELKKAAGKKE